MDHDHKTATIILKASREIGILCNKLNLTPAQGMLALTTTLAAVITTASKEDKINAVLKDTISALKDGVKTMRIVNKNFKEEMDND